MEIVARKHIRESRRRGAFRVVLATLTVTSASALGSLGVSVLTAAPAHAETACTAASAGGIAWVVYHVPPATYSVSVNPPGASVGANPTFVDGMTAATLATGDCSVQYAQCANYYAGSYGWDVYNEPPVTYSVSTNPPGASAGYNPTFASVAYAATLGEVGCIFA